MIAVQQKWNQNMEVSLHIAIWIFMILVYAFIFSQFMGFQASLLRALSNVLPMAAIFYANLWLVNRYLEQKKFYSFIATTLIVFLIATSFRAEMNSVFPDFRRELILMTAKRSWYVGALLTNLSVLVIGIFYQMLYNRYQREKRNLSIINEQREAQLQALRAQINPHFLFNTLNNIYSLAVVRSEKTADMVLKLSKLLRYVIYDSREAQVGLKKETEQLEEYIRLFQMRMEEPANIQFQYTGIEEGQQIEPMVLMSFLENGFKHGDFDTNPAAFLKADLKVENEVLDFQMLNSKSDLNQQKDKQGGVGLDNIKKRLDLKYKEHYQLEIHDQQDQFFVHFKLAFSNGSN